ncbi:hypothetical protein NDU88_002875 [Pleurodeles waltl]|uniref:Uncharacterized protein n=1 Tax=Pleurodeles waltl TaxID=8319 RepID=A0AAV7T3C5_PLEWA|nr:hypothetical protein NDU88_002875 [Pleurodeles waltl]
MDHLVLQLREGQQKLEWALEKQMTQGKVDWTVFANGVCSQEDNLTKMAKGKTQMVAGIGLSQGLLVSGAMVPLQKYIPGEDPVNFE